MCRLLLAAFVAICLLPGAAAAEIWIDATGIHKTEAEFLALRGETVYLKKTNGVTIAVPLANLDAASQQLARRLAAPPAADQAPDAAVRALMTNFQLGEFRAAWDALPASYQNDAADVIHAFGQNMDGDVWNAGTRILNKAVTVLREKKAFILGYPALQRPGMDLAAAGKNWDLGVGLLETIVGSELNDLKQLASLDVGTFLDGTGQQIGAQLARLTKALEQDVDPAALPIPLDFPGAEVALLGDLQNATITTLQTDGDTATVRIENNGQTKDQELVRVEGKWLPRDMVEGWSEGIAKAKEFLTTQMPEQLKASKQQLLSPLSPVKMVEGVLDQLLQTQNQAQFNQVIDGIIEMVGGLVGNAFGAGEAGADPLGAPPAQTAPKAADPFGTPPADSAPPAADDPFGA